MQDSVHRLSLLTRIVLGVFAFLLVQVVYFYTADPAGDIKRLLVVWTAGILGFVWLGALYWGRQGLRRPPIFTEVVLLFLAIYGVAALTSSYVRIGLAEWALFASFFVLYFIASQVYTDEDKVAPLLKSFCITAAIAAIYAIMQKAGVDPLPWSDRTSDTYTNLPATYGNPNFAAHVLILLIIAAIYLWSQGWWWALPCGVLFLYHFGQTGQRAGWIALAAAAALVGVAWLVNRTVKRSLAAAVLAIVATVLLGALAGGGVAAYTKATTGTPFPLDVSLLLRYQSYVSASEMLLDKPLLGHGPGVYKIGYPAYWTDFEQQWFAEERRQNRHVHNDILELAIDGGMAAAGLYVSMLLLAIGFSLILAFDAESQQRRRLGYALAAMFTAFAVDGLFGFNLRVPISATLFFLLLGVLEGLWHGGHGIPQPVQGARLPRNTAFAAVALLLLFSVVTGTRVFAGEYWLNAGKEAQANRQFDYAREAFTRSASLAPWQWDSERWLGLIALKQDLPVAGLEHFEKAARICPDYLLTQLDLADSKLLVAAQAAESKELPQAFRLLEEAKNHANFALEICPMFARAETLLGRANSIAGLLAPQQGEHAAAQAEYWSQANNHFLRAIDFGAENRGELYRMIANNFSLAGDLDTAETMLARAVQVEPTNVDAWNSFLQFTFNHKKFDRARSVIYAQIDRLQSMEPVDSKAIATAHLWLAQVLEKGDQNLEAADHAFTLAVQYEPHEAQLWTQFAQYAYRNGRVDVLREAILANCRALEAEGVRPLSQVGPVYAVLDQGASAAEDASLELLAAVRGHQASPEFSDIQAYSWSAQMIEDILAEDQSGDPLSRCRAVLNMSIIAARLDQLGKANMGFQDADACLSGPDRAILAVHWADTLARINRGDEAIAKLRESLELYPDNMDVRLGLARSLKNFGFIEEAKMEYLQLLEQVGENGQDRVMLEKELNAL